MLKSLLDFLLIICWLFFFFFNVVCIGKSHSKSVFGKDRNLKDEVLEHYDGILSPL